MAEKSGSPAAAQEQQQSQQSLSELLGSFIAEIVRSPVNLALVGLIAFLVYKIVKTRTRTEEPVQETKKLPKLRRDFAIEELSKYDGKGPDGRILVAVNGSVYDVTRGARFYGPGESCRAPPPRTTPINSPSPTSEPMRFFSRDLALRSPSASLCLVFFFFHLSRSFGSLFISSRPAKECLR